MGEAEIIPFTPLLGEFPFTKDDFLTGTKPYEYLFDLRDNKFRHDQELARLTAYARSQDVRNFNSLYKAYRQSVGTDGQPKQATPFAEGNYTAFLGQEMELNCGSWTADDTGIYREGISGREYACRHPIYIKERLMNIDTGLEAVTLAFRKSWKSKWRALIVDRKTIANAREIVSLAAYGIAVTSENARLLVQYLSELDSFNLEEIPQQKSVGRLGYISGEGFSPYVPGLTFDGEANFKPLYDAIHEQGSFEAWQNIALHCREESVAAKIMVAASLAAPLVAPLGVLPFFVHLWGVDSGTGKTVGLMLAASVWADPEPGKYLRSFNATSVGLERTAAFLNHLPLCLDELQLSKDSRGKPRFNVYELAEGVGRSRGTKYGGTDVVPTWRTCFLTTGESPLVGQSAGAGAVNRVMEIECTVDHDVLSDGHAVAEGLRNHFGFAGKKMAQRLYAAPENLAHAREYYEAAYRLMLQEQTTEKQAMAAAILLTAEWLAFSDGWVFTEGSGTELTPDEIGQFLVDQNTVSVGQRAYDFLLDWVAQNKFHFDRTAVELVEDYGEFDLCHGVVYIVKSVFDKVMMEHGFDPKAVLSWMKGHHKLKLQKSEENKRTTVTHRVSGVLTRCVALFVERNPNTEENGEE